MAPKTYDAMYKKFVEHIASRKVSDNAEIRILSKEFAITVRGKNDLYARKYHAHFFTEWCVTNNIAFPDDWNPEGFWAANFA